MRETVENKVSSADIAKMIGGRAKLTDEFSIIEELENSLGHAICIMGAADMSEVLKKIRLYK